MPTPRPTWMPTEYNLGQIVILMYVTSINPMCYYYESPPMQAAMSTYLQIHFEDVAVRCALQQQTSGYGSDRKKKGDRRRRLVNQS